MLGGEFGCLVYVLLEEFRVVVFHDEFSVAGFWGVVLVWVHIGM